MKKETRGLVQGQAALPVDMRSVKLCCCRLQNNFPLTFGLLMDSRNLAISLQSEQDV